MIYTKNCRALQFYQCTSDVSYAPFTLLRFCTKTEKEISVFVKTVYTTPHKNAQTWKFSKLIFTKTEGFENAVDQCERTKMDKNKNAAIATIKYFTHFSPNSALKLKKAKTYEVEYIKFCRFS